VVGADAIYSSSRKWMAGPRGVGVLAIRPALAQRLRPRLPPPDWDLPLTVLQRLETGDANVAARVGYSVALGEHLATGPDRIRARLAELGHATRTALADVAGRWGLAARVERVADGRSNVHVTTGDAEADGPDVLMVGHLDTVPADPAGWTVDPFAGRLVDGYLLERVEGSEHAGQLTWIEKVVSPEPVLTPQVLAAARVVADRYAGSLGDVSGSASEQATANRTKLKAKLRDKVITPYP